MSKEETTLDVVEVDGQEAAAVAEGEVFVTPRESGNQEDALRAEIDELQQEIDRVKELYLRKLADFDNYRKRQEREMAEYRRLANANLIRDLLGVVDNLERATAAVGGSEDSLRTGVQLVLKQLKEALAKHGVVEIDPQGQVFDPTMHEAIQRVEQQEAAENTIVQVLQKGFMLGERLLRPALVVVAVPASRPATEFEGNHGQDHRN